MLFKIRMQEERSENQASRKAGEPLLQPPSNIDKDQMKSNNLMNVHVAFHIHFNLFATLQL